jgi:hypothetical protein
MAYGYDEEEDYWQGDSMNLKMVVEKSSIYHF